MNHFDSNLSFAKYEIKVKRETKIGNALFFNKFTKKLINESAYE